MQINVRFFTSLREITGKKEENLSFPQGETVTINTVLKALSKQHGRAFVEYIYDSKTGEVRSFLQFLVNGQATKTQKGVETELENGDILAILPPVGGG
jgi:molybdopterin synthase sulfur carrier subunit